VKVRKNFYMLAGAGGNIGVRSAPTASSSSMPDRRRPPTGAGGAEDADRAAHPLHHHADAGADFVGGNEKLAKAGYTIFTNALGGGGGLPNGGGAVDSRARQRVEKNQAAARTRCQTARGPTKRSSRRAKPSA